MYKFCIYMGDIWSIEICVSDMNSVIRGDVLRVFFFIFILGFGGDDIFMWDWYVDFYF